MTNSYEHLVKKSTYFAVSIAILLIIIKLMAWWLIGSMSLLASLFDSSMDLFASALSFLMISYSLKPADNEHRFGHGKAESLAALAQSAFIIGSAIFLLLSSVRLISEPAEINSPIVGITSSAISVVFTLGLVLYQKHVIKLTGSQAIKADMLHYFSDLLMNIAVIIALALSAFGMIYADAIFALLISLYIIYNALHIAFIAIQDLLDRALPDKDNALISEIALKNKAVKGIHDLKTRRSGPITFVQLHVELDEQMPLITAHEIADEIEKSIEKAFSPAEVIVHQDPKNDAVKN